MFRAEVRFYREIAPVVGIRVPTCYSSEIADEGTTLVLEDLSAWTPHADPVAHATVLSDLHQRWAGRAATRWPWLRPVGAGADLVDALYRRIWPGLAERNDLTKNVRMLGERLVDPNFVAPPGPTTLIHGDASSRNTRVSAEGAVALIDWEDVGAAPGVIDLAWLLVSSVDPAQWDEVIAAYGDAHHLDRALPAAAVQGLLSLADTTDEAEAADWIERLDETALRLSDPS